MLRPEEIEMLVCGNPKLDMSELKKVTVYDGFSPHDNTIR
jgi:E3 ubiquitin-protein ligase HECTD2